MRITLKQLIAGARKAQAGISSELPALLSDLEETADLVEAVKRKAIAIESRLRPLEDLSALIPTSVENELLDAKGSKIKSIKR